MIIYVKIYIKIQLNNKRSLAVRCKFRFILEKIYCKKTKFII